MSEFRMPSLGADMDEGTLVEWMVRPGDHVQRGDVIASVDTDKATIEVEVFDTGTVERLLVEPGEVVPVGTPLAIIGTGGGTASGEHAGPGEHERGTTGDGAPGTVADGGRPDEPRSPEPTRAPRPVLREAEPLAVDGGTQHHHASVVLSPLVRHLAERLGVDPGAVSGTGPGGRITRSDVERAATGRRAVPVGSASAAAAAAPGAPVARRTRAGLRASPRARRRATQLGLELDRVTGTGPGGAITEADVDAVARTVGSAAESVALDDGSGVDTVSAVGGPSSEGGEEGTAAQRRAESMRRAIARTMSRANREIPHYYLATTVDLDAATRFLEQRNAGRPPDERVLPAALVLRAIARSVAKVPQVNGHWVEDRFVPGGGVHLAMAVSLREGGLIAPVLHDADQLTVDEVMERLKDLVERARRGALRGSELEGATMTVTNLGDRGVESVQGVVHPPQVALVGVGRIQPRALVVDGEVCARPSVVVSLAADHRATDGQTGSRFLNRIDTLLQRPDAL